MTLRTVPEQVRAPAFSFFHQLPLEGRERVLLKGLTQSSLLRDAGHLATGQGLRLVIQAAYFVLIARSLGPDRYGAFAAVVALAAILAPFSGLGTNNLFIKNVRSGKREASLCWGNGLVATTASGFAFIGIVLLINSLFHLRMAVWVVIPICVADLLLMRYIELALFGFAAVDHMKENAVQSVVSSLVRLIAAAVLAGLHGSITLQYWAFAYLVATFFSTCYALYRSHRLWGRPTFNWSDLKKDASEGIYFSIGNSAATIYNDLDKVMLGKVSYVAVGIYAAAYRIIDVSMTPIRSLASAAYPRFFQEGLKGMKPAHAYASTQIKRAAIYSFVLFPMIWIGAPLLPRVLGPNYEHTVGALRWLAVIPVLRAAHVFLADSLSGAGFQSLRSAIQVTIAIVNAGLNVLILPRYGWRGAAWTSIASDALLLIILWIAIQYKLRSSLAPADLSVNV